MKLEELLNTPFAEECEGIGTCGITYNEEYDTHEGYIYANSGYGNMEVYYRNIAEFITTYGAEWDIVDITYNDGGEILSLHGWAL